MELLPAFMEHAESYYVRPDGTPTTQQRTFLDAMRPVKRLYGMERASDFGPKKPRAIRHIWVDKGLSRSTVNKYTGAVKRILK